MRKWHLSARYFENLSKLLGVSRSTSLFFYDIGFILKVSQIIIESNIVQIEEPEAGGLLIPIISRIFKKNGRG